jgi:hypothetical protein
MPSTRLFRPPFCPRPLCVSHQNPQGWRFVRWGSYIRTCPRVRSIPRFRCSQCRRTFSQQTFQTTYWLRRPELLVTIAERVVAGSGLRQIARSLRCSPSTVMTHLGRLGRHALLFLEQHRPRGVLREPLVVDGFESFAFSQYYPLHLNLAVGSDSHFTYAFTESELRRKGRMTAKQKRKRQQEETVWGRPDPRAIETGVRELVEIIVPPEGDVVIRSDEHRAYPRALRVLSDRLLRHEVTSSKAARTTGNPLFPVNRQDLMLRHCGANHRRETIAFSKLRAGVIERAAIQAVWMNFVKAVSEKRPGVTPAMRLGICEEPLSLRQILGKRLFRSRMALPEVWRRYYERRVVTRRIPHSRPHVRVFAD